MELNVIGAKPLSVSDEVFGAEFKQALVHQVVVAYQAGGRAGTKAQLSRGEMSGTTKKFKKQKGGGARHGDYRAPIFVGGGVTFAAKPRSYEQKVNRKAYRVAIRSILAELNRAGRLKMVESFGIDSAQDARDGGQAGRAGSVRSRAAGVRGCHRVGLPGCAQHPVYQCAGRRWRSTRSAWSVPTTW